MTDRAQQGSNIRRLREDRGLTQRDLAYFARCSHVTIVRLEKGDLSISAGLKARIARALGVPLRDLWPLESTT